MHSISQMDLIQAISKELQTQGVKRISQAQFNEIILAADSVKQAFAVDPNKGPKCPRCNGKLLEDQNECALYCSNHPCDYRKVL